MTSRRIRQLSGAIVALAVLARLSAQHPPVTVEREGDRLRVVAPGFHFLTGPPLDRLRDGGTVTYALTVSIHLRRGEPKGPRITREVVFSYDLWEERFSVSRLDDPKAAASHLTASAAESWCLDLLTLPVPAGPVDRTFVVKLECSLRNDGTPRAGAPAATTVAGLIDLLSRKARAAPPRWEAESPPLRLADLKDRAVR